MHLEGTETIDASKEAVWAFLTNPDAVAECVPGLKKVDVIEPDKKFRAVASLGLGSMRLNFTNDVEFGELDPPNRAEVIVHGKAPGSVVDVNSEMILSDAAEGGTDLHWAAEIVVMGKIATLASRMMGTTAKQLSGQFFKCAKKKIE